MQARNSICGSIDAVTTSFETAQQHLRENGIANGRLNHYRPAAHLLREQTDLIPKIDKDTLQRAGSLFKRLNSLLD